MSKIIKAIRGMNDILPEEAAHWRSIESKLKMIATSYGYREIRFPIVENSALFKRTIGEATDIVEKEMYTFEDSKKASLSLRPEGTAGCTRASIEHSLLYSQPQRLWYLGPMFRHERPQHGRYRQFHQFGVEAFGMPGPDIDAELIFMSQRIFKALNIDAMVKLQLNSLGSPISRERYRERLVKYFQGHMQKLDEDSQRRLFTNPLRILDSKNKDMQQLIQQAPKIQEDFDESSQHHFQGLCKILDAASIAYHINSHLVRGLDYYTHTVFEWVTEYSGAQNAICSGGRYDGLVTQLGGHPTPAIGFALGLERLANLVPMTANDNPQVYLIRFGEKAHIKGLLLAEKLRTALPKLKIMVDGGGGQLKAQFKRADKSGASFALVLGENECIANKIAVKNLREEQPQHSLNLDETIQFLTRLVKEEQNS